MSKINGGKAIILFDIDHTLFNVHQFWLSNQTVMRLFKEIKPLLTELSPHYTLGILSEGDLEFQKNKLLKTEIDHYFDPEHTHIVLDKLSELPDLLQKYKTRDVILVDDKLTVLYNAKQQLPSVKTIWIKRGMYADLQKPIAGFSPDATVLSLENLKAVIERLT